MLENINTNKPNYWIRILLIGFIIYILTIMIFVLTENSNLTPTIVLLGNFLIPVSFVSFFYERRNRFSVSMASTSISFFYGGVLGTITAALLEPIFISALTFNTAFIVGFIEEFTKLIGVLLIARHRRRYSEMDGIILGAAAGMGFAAFESVGYTFTAFLQSGGSLSDVVAVTLIRGIASPVGHGTWTAILACVLFRESFSGGFNINHKVVGAYLTVVILHGLWNGLPFFIDFIFPVVQSVLLGQLSIGFVGLLILYRRWKEAKAEPFLNLV
jgi:protease PrsW